MINKKFLKPLLGTLLTFAIIIGGITLFKGSNHVFAKYYYWNGYSKQNAQDWEGAIEDYSKVLEYDNGFVTAYISRGSAYVDLKQYVKAISDYNIAIELTPNDAQIYAYRGRAFYETEKYGKAMSDYDRSLTLDNKFAYAYYNRGLLKYAIHMDFVSGCDDFFIASELGHDQATDVILNGDCD